MIPKWRATPACVRPLVSPQSNRLALKLIGKPTLRCLRHRKPPDSAEPIIGVCAIGGRSLAMMTQEMDKWVKAHRQSLERGGSGRGR